MLKYLKNHEQYIREILNKEGENYDWGTLRKYHETQIKYMQHERFIHLVVTLFFGLFSLLTFLFMTLSNTFATLLLSILFNILLIPYIIHYYKLENGVQRWYEIDKEIIGKISKNRDD